MCPGTYTGIELLDTLEVVAHERYEDLLKKAGVLSQAFVDYRTRAVLRTNAQGEQVVATETTESTPPPLLPTDGITPTVPAPTGTPPLVVTPVEERRAKADAAAVKLRQPIPRRSDVSAIHVPLLRVRGSRSHARIPARRACRGRFQQRRC
jgi:type III restriction enzyme